jgi:hypothetical protein
MAKNKVFRKKGFEEAMALPDKMLKAALYTQEWYLNALATKFAYEVRAIIDNKSENWVPLNPKYKEWKVSKGYSAMIYKQREDLYKKLSITPVSKKKVFVGWEKGVKNQGEVEIAMYAAANEYGVESKGLPSRPLLRPAFEKTTRWAFDNKNLFLGQFLEKLKSQIL